MSAVQSVAGRYPPLGYPGDLARAGEPFAFDLLNAQVPTNGRKPRPGDALYYDAANNGVAVPTSATQVRSVLGICSYDPGTVTSTLPTGVPTGANSDQFIEYDDGDAIKMIVFGTVWIIAGAAMEYGQTLAWDTTNNDFRPLSRQSAVANLHLVNIVCVSPAPVAADGVAQVRVGFGRAL